MSDTLIVIPCLNEETHIKALTLQLTASNPNMRVVIVDGGSTDRTPQIAQELAKSNPQIIYLNNPKRIQSAAINLAVKEHATNAKYIIRIDAHAEYPEDYCQTLREEAETTGAAAVVVAMHTVGKNEFQRAIAAAQNSKLGNGGAAHRNIGKDGKWVDHGHHALIRTDVFKNVGGYDETFTHNEDAEFDARLIRARYKIWLTGKTSITYYPRSSPWPLVRQYFYYGFGRAQNILKHGSWPKVRQLVPAAIAPALILMLFDVTAWPVLIWAGFCLGYGGLLAYKAKDKWIALAGPAAMLMHMGWSIGFWAGIVAMPRRQR